MGKAKHGRCKRGVRSALGSIDRPGVGTKEVPERFWREMAVGLSSEKAAELAGASGFHSTLSAHDEAGRPAKPAGSRFPEATGSTTSTISCFRRCVHRPIGNLESKPVSDIERRVPGRLMGDG